MQIYILLKIQLRSAIFRGMGATKTGGINTTRTKALLIIAWLWSIIPFVFDVKISASFHTQNF